MSKYRNNRIAEEIKRIISLLLQRQVKDPIIHKGHVTVSQVYLSGDMSLAKVFVSTLGQRHQQEKILLALQRAKGYLRRELANHLDIKFVPEIQFIIDKSIEQGVRMTALLDQLVSQEEELHG